MADRTGIAIVGAGFTGLSAALHLARAGETVTILEMDSDPGGLASSFEFRDGVRVEKFYHHWFNSDRHIFALIEELGLANEVLKLPSRTGMYYNGTFWRLSTPFDLLRFSPLSLLDRVRLGLLVFQVRRVKDWRTIEHLSIRQWLEPLCGANVFRIVWEPLIRAKFSAYADTVNAVWFWKKLVLRGSTRDKHGAEQVAYFKGGFSRLAHAMVEEIRRRGGEVRYNTVVTRVAIKDGLVSALRTSEGERIDAQRFLFTPSFPIIAELFEGQADPLWVQSLRRIRYLGNICLVLELDRSLSDTYWLNVNDPGFPFVGVIEHTNLDNSTSYGGNRIVYISRYLATTDPVWRYQDAEYLEFALKHLRRMFPKLGRSWVRDYRIWRAEYAQPVTEKDYSKYVPDYDTPFPNAWIATMAQIYPEDRGTNYAIREGRVIAKKILGGP